jgi:Mg2+ and Co2+ transporter CorA
MSFGHLPELGWRCSYLAWWIGVLGITAAMPFHFRRRRWL